MARIMFVCHGNICRSPMAEFIMKKLVRDTGLQDSFCIESSATSTEEIWNGKGNPVYPPAKAELKKHGISCEGKCAVQLKKSDYENYDYFIGMDSANIRNMRRILGNDKDEKIYKLLSFAGRGDDVADPWYSGDFETTYRDIYEGCDAFLKYLTGEDRNNGELKNGF
ncbi:MAG: low molecular weight protein-tyrosine-phosphatase [Porcipelethomonas sp.]